MSQPSMPKPFDPRVRYGRMLGLLFAVLGFAAMGLGWNGAARNAIITKQFPYLISGGLAGLGLVLMGAALLLMAQLRSERTKLAEQLEQVSHLLSKVSAAATPRPTEAVNGQVVAGKSTYHRPDCRLVAGKDELDVVSVDAAKASGLSPCRVCAPEESDRPVAGAGGKSRRGRSRQRGRSR